MCLAIPGKVVEIGDNKFVIDYGGIRREAIMSAVDNLKIGDFVVVSNKVILEKLNKNKAEELLNFLK